MKSIYTIMFDHQEPSDAEAARWQNFDQLIANYQMMERKRRRTKYGWYGALLLVVLVVGSGLVYQQVVTHSLTVPTRLAPLPPTIRMPTLPDVARQQLPPVSADVQAAASSFPTKTDQAAGVPTDTQSIQVLPSEAEPRWVEAQPAGGYPALYDFFANALQYPEAARQEKVSGSVLMEFMVDIEGRPTQVRVVQGLREDLDQEAIRLIRTMPTWTPAKLGDEPIATRHTMPLTFQLTKP